MIQSWIFSEYSMTKLIIIGAIVLIAFLGYQSYMANETPIVGEKSPDFNLPDSKSNSHSLAQYSGKWLILYFYPKDDTPGCTAQACNFRNDLHKLEKMDAKVIGVSVDGGRSHAIFAKKYNLPFALLSDETGAVAKEYGALTDLGFFKIAKRYTFLIDPNGILRKSYFSVDTSRHSQQIIDDLNTLQHEKISALEIN